MGNGRKIKSGLGFGFFLCLCILFPVCAIGLGHFKINALFNMLDILMINSKNQKMKINKVW